MGQAQAAEAVDLNEGPAGGLTVLAVALGAILLAAGSYLLAWNMAGGSGSTVRHPPPGAQEIPRTVGTAVPALVIHAAPPIPASDPVRIEIAQLGISAPVIRLGLNEDGTVQVPPLQDHNLAGWYTGSVTPGQRGSSVILGHVDSYQGASVFYAIKDLIPGDLVTVVRADGGTAVFAVDGVQKVAKVAFPSDTVYGNTAYPSLRLITCGGPFDAATGEYQDNIVVYAHLTASAGVR